MKTTSETKSCFEQLSFEIYARQPRKNNQKVCLISNQDQIKISLSVKIVVALSFMCLIIKILDLEHCPVCNV